MSNARHYLQRCIQLARNGLGTTYPNPLVGSVIVYKDNVIGEGFHYKSGEPHAEVVAINSVKNKDLLKDSTLYVNLEPCNHHGKTPACTEYIIKNQLKKVVIAGIDHNPMVNGTGVQRLKDSKIEVIIEEALSKDNLELNKRFYTFHTKKRPYIILKYAQSADGFIDGENEKPISISGKAAQQLSHKWRTEEQAILVGKNTVLKDNPQLNSRLWKGSENYKIIIDPSLEIPKNYNIFKQANVLIYNNIKNEIEDNIEYIKYDNTDSKTQPILDSLYRKEIQSVIIEGGAATIQHFIDENIWDEARIFTQPNLEIHKGVALPQWINSPILTQTDWIEDTLLEFYKNSQS